MQGTKYSRQREAIITYLRSTKAHPTADTIYNNIREIYPNISLGTVYRNLNLLCEQKEIIKLHCDNDCERFDGNPMPHHHFVCKKCGCVLDLHMESIDHIKTIASYGFEGDIEDFTIYFSGICPNCKKR